MMFYVFAGIVGFVVLVSLFAAFMSIMEGILNRRR